MLPALTHLIAQCHTLEIGTPLYQKDQVIDGRLMMTLIPEVPLDSQSLAEWKGKIEKMLSGFFLMVSQEVTIYWEDI